MKKYIVFLALVPLVFGCASGGNEKVRSETMDSVAAKVTKGATTKEQIKTLYGEPSHVTLTDGGNEVWTYQYAHATATAVSYVPIVGIFAGGSDINKNNIMQNYTVHSSQSTVHRGGKDLNDN